MKQTKQTRLPYSHVAILKQLYYPAVKCLLQHHLWPFYLIWHIYYKWLLILLLALMANWLCQLQF